VCGKPETVEHIISACERYNFSLYLDRHNDVALSIHRTLGHKYGLDFSHWRRKTPQVIENEKVIILWDFAHSTPRGLKACRPDITVYDKQSKSVYLVEVTVPQDELVVQARSDKLDKYEPLIAALSELHKSEGWKEAKQVTVVIGALGTVPEATVSDLMGIGLSETEASKATAHAQRAAVLGTVRVIRRHFRAANSSDES